MAGARAVRIPQVRVLFVCTANICRSPMAAAFWSGTPVGSGRRPEAASAGLLPGGMSPPSEVLSAMDDRGFDLRGHRSRQLTADMLAPADLVVGMGRKHVQEAVLLDRQSWPRAFTLKEVVRRGEAVGPRPDGVTVAAWMAAVHAGRTWAELAGREVGDEVADPFGGPLDGYRRTAAELDGLVRRLAGLVRPGAPGDRPPPVPVPELDDVAADGTGAPD